MLGAYRGKIALSERAVLTSGIWDVILEGLENNEVALIIRSTSRPGLVISAVA
jgi:hypothetical protein